MVNKNIVISDPEHMQYANYSAQKISMYYKYLYKAEKHDCKDGSIGLADFLGFRKVVD